MLTGYWPPTNELLRQFSDDPNHNPGVWVGEDWEGRGYDIYAFFPEFPGGVTLNPKGNGDFEVDYQDTSWDWEDITALMEPIAIITFSRANHDNGWELESRNRKLPLNSWSSDYLTPFKPTPELPIAGEPDNFIRYSSLPMQEIVEAVAASDADVQPFIDTSNNFGGSFLSEYIGYHGNWYHDQHADPNDPIRMIAAGHIHVGRNTVLADAVLASEVTLRVLIRHLNRTLCPDDLDGSGVTDQSDLGVVLGDFGCTGLPGDCAGDLDNDGQTGQSDLGLLLSHYGQACPRK